MHFRRRTKMATKVIEIEAESELARALRRASTSGESLEVRAGRNSYGLDVKARGQATTRNTPSPEQVAISRAAIEAAAGSWKGIVDVEELKAYIRERRLTPGRGTPGFDSVSD
jgi:hypothetical protein